jgi:hypothetical protein
MANTLPTTELTKKQLYMREYYQEHREEMIAAQKERDSRRVEERRAQQREYYQRNRAKRLAENKEYNRTHRDEINARARERLSSPQRREQVNAYNRDWRKVLRAEVLHAYGDECACCGEKEEAFLEAHHKNGGGNKHRRELGGNAKLYGWLKRNNFPQEFGLLCSNCNKAEYTRGICPHRLKRLEGSVN